MQTLNREVEAAAVVPQTQLPDKAAIIALINQELEQLDQQQLLKILAETMYYYGEEPDDDPTPLLMMAVESYRHQWDSPEENEAWTQLTRTQPPSPITSC